MTRIKKNKVAAVSGTGFV